MKIQRTEELLVTLEPDQLMARGQELSERVDELKRMKENHVRQKKAMKKAEEELEATVLQLSESRRTGEERRPVRVEDVVVLSSFAVQTVRLDTGEVIRERAMTKEEIENSRQTEMVMN